VIQKKVCIRTAIAVSLLFFNEDGSLQKGTTYSPYMFNVYKKKHSEEKAHQMANVVYNFTQKEPNQMTSIAAVCTLDTENQRVVNNSFLDLQKWDEHPNLPSVHTVLWRFTNIDEGTQSTALIIECRSIPNSDNVNIVVRPPHYLGEPLPAAIQINDVSGDVKRFVNLDFDDNIGEALYNYETNTAHLNPSLTKCQALNELWPSDNVGKRENDSSSVIDLRTGDRIGNW